MRSALFERMDVNRDGILTPDEIRAAGNKIKAAQAARLADLSGQARYMDANGDGKISRDEFAAFIPQRLQQADADGDKA
jgi:Ca2+-binding EF-hand superfamily protein